MAALEARTPERRTEEERKWFEGVLVKAIGDGEEIVGAALGMINNKMCWEKVAAAKARFDSLFDDQNRQASMLSCLVLLRSMARATSVEWADGSSDNEWLRNVAQQPELTSKFIEKFPDDVRSHPPSVAGRMLLFLENLLCHIYELTLSVYKEERRGGDIWLRRRQWRVRHSVSTDGSKVALHEAPDMRSNIVGWCLVGEVIEAAKEHDGWILIEPRRFTAPSDFTSRPINEPIWSWKIGGFCPISLTVRPDPADPSLDQPIIPIPLLERVSRENERALEVMDAFHKADPEDWQKQIIDNTGDPYRGAPFDYESLASFIFRKAQLHSYQEEDHARDLSLTFDPDIVITALGHEVRGRSAAVLWIRNETTLLRGIHPEHADTPDLRGEPNRVVFIGERTSDRFVRWYHQMVHGRSGLPAERVEHHGRRWRERA